MLISRSIGRKIAATATAAVAFVLLYEARALDMRLVVRQAAAEVEEATAPTPVQGDRLRFAATAYCKGTTTASGVNVRTGIAASDPDLLPVGSVVLVDKLGDLYDGIYTILDTGPKVIGRHIDIYMWNCNEALTLGRRNIGITVLRLGWNPRASTPSLINRLFHAREAAQQAPPLLASRPIDLR